MQSFSDAIASIPTGENPTILLGNGFSQAWDASIFNYANLLRVAQFGARDAEIKDLFARIDTFDFESVMNELLSAERVLEAYGGDPALIDLIREDQNTLKNSLIEAISQTHPDYPWEVSVSQYQKVRGFLSQFREVFTLNYDLLFYWARNQNDVSPVYRTDDGFRAGQCWEGYETDQDVHFLHGGLHIYESGGLVLKHASQSNGRKIIDLVRDNLNNGKFPMFVSEPTSQKKKHKIEHNPYLNYCFEHLRRVKGTLFIYGHSMDENDKHIFDQIQASAVTKIFVSIFGDEHSDANKRAKANASAYLDKPGRVIEFYKAESTPVWS